MEVNKVLYLLGLEKNILLVLAIEDRGLEVNFMGAEVLLGWSQQEVSNWEKGEESLFVERTTNEGSHT